MSSLILPEDQATYNKCKYIVKLWEHKFKKTHNRLPSKLDIREANQNVRNAYKKYFQLKTAILEQSFKDVDGFNWDDDNDDNHEDNNIKEQESINTESTCISEDTVNLKDAWSFELDRKIDKKTETVNDTSTNLNSTFAKKIFCGSKFLKRNPRKSLSFTQRKSSEINIDNEQTSLSQPNLKANDDIPVSFEGLFKSNQTQTIKIVERKDEISTQSTNLIQSVLENNYQNLKEIDKNWVRRVGYSVDPSISWTNDNSEYHSDDIVDNSDDESSSMQFRKKIKIDDDPSKSKPIPETVRRISANDEKETNDQIGENKTIRVEKNENNLKADNSTHKTADSSNSDCPENDPDYVAVSVDIKEPTKRSVKKTKVLRKLAEKMNKKHTKRTKPPKIVDENEDNDDNTTYELEYSIKPRKSVPRCKNLKELIHSTKNVGESKTEPTRNSSKLMNKIKNGTLNDNYVTINLKKKIYSRGKKTMNFSKFKLKQWKSKKKFNEANLLDLNGCDGGYLKCFNCNEDGHFARNCPKNKGDKLLNLIDENDEDISGPTLEEAAEMAKNSVFAVRKPNLSVQEEKDDHEIDNDEDINSDNYDDCDTHESGDDNLFDETENDDLLTETLRLEEEVAKLNLQQFVDSKETVEPYFSLNADGSLIETPNEVFEALTEFGHSSFRPGQELAIMRILSGKSTLVTLSTGSGKSLCYQLPAYLYHKRQNCITLIISPLVSLMEDQISGIPKFLRAACLHTNQTKIKREQIIESITSGDLSILLVSPEAVIAGERSSWFGSFLRKLPPIAFACIDEAHCVSQWSHNFRPSYLMICHVLRERIGIKTILGLTATATKTTMNSIIEHLHITDGENGVISDIPLPNNLYLTVSKDLDKDQALLDLITTEKFRNYSSIIIYCTRREECNRIANFLRTSLQYCSSNSNNNKDNKRKRFKVAAEPYHAGLSATKRRTIQKNFMLNELRIVVATVAFGMGINKPDIRAVIHYNMPKNFESYVQEIGRAGRDSLPAHCHLFLDYKNNDQYELQRHIYSNSIDRFIIRKLLQRIFLKCSCKDVCPRHEVAFSIEETVKSLDITEENISTLLCYLELHENKYIELLSPAYTICKIISYGSFNEIEKAAKECPPLAMALALQKNNGNNQKSNIIEFKVVDIAATIGWDSGICKLKLKNLEWTSFNGQPKRSKLSVQFSNLGFRLLAPGNLTDNQLDEALDNLYNQTINQERTSLLQLHALHQTLSEMATRTYRECLDDITDRSDVLKLKIREYFNNSDPLSTVQISNSSIIDEQTVINNIRGLISAYRDNNFTGRAIARIFHGIPSPNYPAIIWGRCKYWRCMIKIDFHTICRLATKEILNFK